MTDAQELEDEADTLLEVADERQLRRRIRLKAMDLLARREYGCRELEQRLQRADFPAVLVSETSAALQAEGLLSDERFTEAFVVSRRERGAGPVKIQAELQQRGIDSSLISRYLDFRDPDWLEFAEQARQKKYGQALPAEYPLKMQQARFLANRGFSHEQIRRVLDAEFESG